MTPQETIAHLQSQLDECRKVVAAKDEALAYWLRLNKNSEGDGDTAVNLTRAALALTPADLASKVLVERVRLDSLESLEKAVIQNPRYISQEEIIHKLRAQLERQADIIRDTSTPANERELRMLNELTELRAQVGELQKVLEEAERDFFSQQGLTNIRKALAATSARAVPSAGNERPAGGGKA